jgi:16S rRNA (guanine527-N7)-methyltransferase
MKVITKYFPQLSTKQQQQFAGLLTLYPEWNEKINVISRRDIDNLEINHVLHSLSIAMFINFTPGTCVLDFGAGGGFPSIPLAVMFPEVHFHLVDRIAKKLRVAEDIAGRVGLSNVTVQHGDIKEVKGQYDFIVSRAVMPLSDTVALVRRLVSKEFNNSLPNGLICLKGGELSDEISPFRKSVLIDDISNYFEEEFFSTKKIIYLPL